MSGHTPGPWKWFNVWRNRQLLHSVRLGPEGPGVVLQTSRYAAADIIVSEPDARLIAAAPDLLREAQYALDFLDELEASDNEIFNGESTQAAGWGLATAGLRAAIAKALGESSRGATKEEANG